MLLLRAVEIAKSYGARTVFQGVSLTIADGDRVGVVGANGSGKSTLMRLLAGEPPDAGDVSYPHPGIRISLLPQELPTLSGTVWDAAVGGAGDLLALRDQWTSLGIALGEMPEEASLLRQYGEVQEQLDRAGGFHLEILVQETLTGLGLPKDQWDQDVGSLSGGERSRLNLVRTLVRIPDLLLLDEPTNHLDLAAIEWLEAFLARFRGAVVVASHDRRFLERFPTRILELADGAARIYSGNYGAYRATKDRELRAHIETYTRYQQEVARLREFVRRQLARAEQIQGGPKEGRDHYGRVAKKIARRGQAARKRLARIEQEAPAPPRTPDQVRVRLAAPDGPRGALMHFRGVAKKFGDRELFAGVNLTLVHRDRIGLVGANGTGKTTLLRMLLGDEAPSSGEVWKGPSVRIGYLPQDQRWLGDERRVIDVVLDAGLELPDARALLAALLFRGERVFDQLGNLSGGELTRLAVLSLMLHDANVLLLDEPTNHLDLAARERLEEALEAYGGTIVLASHDRFLLDRLCSGIWAIEGSSVSIYQGGYSDFRARA